MNVKHNNVHTVAAARQHDPEHADDEQSTGQRTRRLEFYIYESHYYDCHRAHNKYIRPWKPEDETIDRRNILKPSKKINCKARLTVRFYQETPGIAFAKRTKDHDKHTPGDPEEIEHLPTTKQVRECILAMLENGHGITRRQIRMKLNKDMLNRPIQHVESQVRTEAIAHIYRKWRNGRTQKDNDDGLSVTRWLDDLEARQYTVWRLANDDTSQYAFGFCSTWQKDELTKSDNWSMDATHHMGPDANALLYTIIVRHHLAHRGIPVAYLFTNDKSAYPVTKWLENISQLGASPKIITIDCDLGEVKAIQTVWGDSCRIQYCTWHVQRAWMNQLVDKAVEWGRAQNKQQRKYIEMQKIRDELKALMWEQDQDKFFSMWDAFKKVWSLHQSAFVNYFERQWMAQDKYPRWARCFHPAVYTNMLTNNYVESWHNQLKTVYLHRKYPRRLDFLIYTLVEDVELDMISEVQRRAARNGQLTYVQRHMLQKKKQADEMADEISDVELSRMIQPSREDDNAFTVESFELDGVLYTVKLSIEYVLLDLTCQ